MCAQKCPLKPTGLSCS